MKIVVAAVVRRQDGRYLLARRLPGAEMAGLWEFPGGAVEPGETAEAALSRELYEELGVEVAASSPFTFAWHRESGRVILLLFYRAVIESDEPCGREGQEVGWFLPSEIAALQMPPADAELVAGLAATAADP